jgi:hypothetical protein
MKIKFLAIILFLFFSTKVIAHLDHYKNVNNLEYELFRNNKSIGYHKYIFKRNNDTLKVESIIDFKITKLGINLYKYNGSTIEEFNEGQLVKFSSHTNQNKKIKNTEIVLDNENNELIISGSENQLIAPKEYFVGTWWDHEIVQAKAQISAISGRIIEQKVTFLGKEKVNLYGKEYETLHFNFKSTDENLSQNKKLNIDVWYEENTGLWLKAAFDKSGYWEYKLKNYN